MANRVEISDIPRPRPLQPVQRTIDTYAAPERPPEDKDTARLAEALQGFAAGLMKLGQVKSSEDPRMAEAYRIMSSYKDPEIVQGLQNGTLPHASVPAVRALYEANVGQRVARSAMDELRLGVQDGTVPLIDNDGRPVDINAAVAERAKKYSGLFPNSVHYWKAFQGAVESGSFSLQDQARAQVAEFNRKRNTELVKAGIEDMIPMAARGDDDDTLRKALETRTRMAREVVGMHPNEVNELFVGRLRELSRQDPDAAERLLLLDRGRGLNGQPLGSLAQTNRQDVREIAQAINEEKGKRYDVAVRKAQAEEAARRLDAGDGSFTTLTDYTYINPFDARDPSKNATKTISRTTVQDEALNLYLQRSNMELARQGLDTNSPAAADTKFQRDYAAFVGANRPHPEWKATLETTATVLSNPVSLSDPRNVRKVQAAGTLYQSLMAKNPGYVTQTLALPERNTKFLDQYDVYAKLGDPPNEAARKAADFVNNPPPALTGDEVSKLNDKIEKIDLNGWSRGGAYNSFSWWGELGPQNLATLKSEIFTTAKAIAADREVPVDKVVDLAVQKVQERTVLFNGQAMPNSAYLTNESKPFYQKRLTELFDQNKQVFEKLGVRSPQELSLREEVPGVFRVVGTDGQSVITPQLDDKGNVTGYSTLRVYDKDTQSIRAQQRGDDILRIMRESADKTDKAIMNDSRPRRLGGATQEQKDRARERYLSRNPPSADPYPDYRYQFP